jgi:hypothetical protein
MSLMKRSNRRGSRMRRLIVAVVSVFAFSGLGISVAHAEPAIVINPFEGICGIITADGGVELFDFDDHVSQITTTESANGNVTFKCKVLDIPNSTGHAVVWNYDNTGFLCQVPETECGNGVDGLTADWHETVSNSGVVKLTCRCDADSSP